MPAMQAAAPASLASPRAPQFRLPVFEGPLDLLVHLIRENRVDIYDIPIAEIARQYMEYLALWDSLDLAIAGEFLVMAATLLEIKSRMLLPQPPTVAEDEEDDDPRAELVQRLLEYERFQAPIEALKLWEDCRSRIYFRGALENPESYALVTPDAEMTGTQLLAALKRMLAEAGVGDEAVTAVLPKRRTGLRLKMAEVLRKVRRHPSGIDFELLLEVPWQRYDIVLTFLALLELLRLRRIRVTQRRIHGTIQLFPVEEAAA